ncbi:MAG: hypothetical protein ACRD4S_12730 [Candidatus Acidiferrales bacterium]
METRTPNLVSCPPELSALDPNAKTLWLIFLKRVGFHIDGQGDVIENETRRADIVRRFGVQSLMQRLSVAKDEISRARIWWRECMACSEGDSIPDLSLENMYVLNPFILTKELKFKNERLAALNEQRACPESEFLHLTAKTRGRPSKPDAAKRAASAARNRDYRKRQKAIARDGLIKTRVQSHVSKSASVSY